MTYIYTSGELGEFLASLSRGAMLAWLRRAALLDDPSPLLLAQHDAPLSGLVLSALFGREEDTGRESTFRAIQELLRTATLAMIEENPEGYEELLGIAVGLSDQRLVPEILRLVWDVIPANGSHRRASVVVVRAAAGMPWCSDIAIAMERCITVPVTAAAAFQGMWMGGDVAGLQRAAQYVAPLIAALRQSEPDTLELMLTEYFGVLGSEGAEILLPVVLLGATEGTLNLVLWALAEIGIYVRPCRRYPYLVQFDLPHTGKPLRTFAMPVFVPSRDREEEDEAGLSAYRARLERSVGSTVVGAGGLTATLLLRRARSSRDWVGREMERWVRIQAETAALRPGRQLELVRRLMELEPAA